MLKKIHMEWMNISGHKKVAWEWTIRISVYLHCGFNCEVIPSSFSLFSLKKKNVSQSFPHSVPQLQPQKKAAYLNANSK